ncbi:MAG: LysE family translocator [Actinomycetes bacterium]
MTLHSYGTFLVLAVLLTVAPGPDFAVVLRNSLAGGRPRGMATGFGVATSNLVQGTAAALGLGALIVRSQVLFETMRWVGVGYLSYLGAQALWSAWRSRTATAHGADLGDPPSEARRRVLVGYRQGFLSNITNPKVLAFYLSVLPQFLDPAAGSAGSALLLAYTHAALSLSWLTLLVLLFHRVRRWVGRPGVRRRLEAATGSLLIAFGVTLAAEGR